MNIALSPPFSENDFQRLGPADVGYGSGTNRLDFRQDNLSMLFTPSSPKNEVIFPLLFGSLSVCLSVCLSICLSVC